MVKPDFASVKAKSSAICLPNGDGLRVPTIAKHLSEGFRGCPRQKGIWEDQEFV